MQCHAHYPSCVSQTFQAQHIPVGILQLDLGSRNKCSEPPKPFSNLSSAQELLLEASPSCVKCKQMLNLSQNTEA